MVNIEALGTLSTRTSPHNSKTVTFLPLYPALHSSSSPHRREEKTRMLEERSFYFWTILYLFTSNDQHTLTQVVHELKLAHSQH